MKKCARCGEEKSLNCFRQFKSGKNKGYYQSYCKKCEKEYKRKYMKEYHKKNKKEKPWRKTYYTICYRCNNPKNDSYSRYKDVKVDITQNELKELWIRDNADSLERPSIDRIDSSKGYTKENCRYIELVENCREGGLKGGKKMSEIEEIIRNLKELHTYGDFEKWSKWEGKILKSLSKAIFILERVDSGDLMLSEEEIEFLLQVCIDNTDEEYLNRIPLEYQPNTEEKEIFGKIKNKLKTRDKKMGGK